MGSHLYRYGIDKHITKNASYVGEERKEMGFA